MLQVYDRILPSGSVPTLFALILIVTLLYTFQGLLEWVRSRLLTRYGRAADEKWRNQTYEATVKLPLIVGSKVDALQPIRDLDQIRTFLSSAGPTAAFDIIWVPFYLWLCFIFHSWIGITASTGAIVLVCLTIVTEMRANRFAKLAAQTAIERAAFADSSRRNAEALQAMGISIHLRGKWLHANENLLKLQQQASDVVGAFSASSRTIRLFLQSAVLAVGAYFAIKGEVTAGTIIAASIITSRALAPLELAITHGKGFLTTYQSWIRLTKILKGLEVEDVSLQHSDPCKSLRVESLSVCPPAESRLAVQNISFQLEAGQGLGVKGASGSGKSSLAKALVGAWPAISGKVKLDGAALEQWPHDKLGRSIGYVPQEVELIRGTVAENISRFDQAASDEKIIAAGRAAHVDELVKSFPHGYKTQVGDRGFNLSAGQRQRIALARALYGDPFLVVLDEPNSNLDPDGERALASAIAGVRKRGGVVIVIAQQLGILRTVDLEMVMENGRASPPNLVRKGSQ